MSDQNTTTNAAPASQEVPAGDAPASQTPEAKDWRAAKEAFLQGSPEDEESGTTPQGTTPPEDGKPEDKKPEDKDPKEERYAKAFSMLTKERSKLRQAQEAFQKEQAEWRSERETLAAFRQNVSHDPVSALRAFADRAGVPFPKLYSSLTQALLQEGQPPDPVEAARAATREELEAFRAEQEKAQREAEEARQRQYLQGEYETTLSDLASLVVDGDYPFCATPLDGQSPEQRAAQVAKAAMIQMAEHYGRAREILSYEEALGRVEAELERAAELHARQAQAAAQRRAAKAPSAASPQDDEPLAAPRTRTLTSRLTSENGPAREVDWRTRRDRFLRGG